MFGYKKMIRSFSVQWVQAYEKAEVEVDYLNKKTKN